MIRGTKSGERPQSLQMIEHGITWPLVKLNIMALASSHQPYLEKRRHQKKKEGNLAVVKFTSSTKSAHNALLVPKAASQLLACYAIPLRIYICNKCIFLNSRTQILGKHNGAYSVSRDYECMYVASQSFHRRHLLLPPPSVQY